MIQNYVMVAGTSQAHITITKPICTEYSKFKGTHKLI